MLYGANIKPMRFGAWSLSDLNFLKLMTLDESTNDTQIV